MLKNRKCFLTLDGTYKIVNKCRKKSDENWVNVSLGTVAVVWNNESKKWVHSYRPFLFMLTKSETINSTKALFDTFYEISDWLGYSKGNICVNGFCSDMAPAFQTPAKEYFKEAVVMSCYPHIFRKPYESYAPKKSIIADNLHTSLKLLRESRSQKEFESYYDFICQYFKKKVIHGSKYVNKIKTICEKHNFRFNKSIPGYATHTQCVERFNRALNENTNIISDGTMFLSEHGSIFELLEISEARYTSSDIIYNANEEHYEKNMILKANSLSYDSNINIKKVVSKAKSKNTTKTRNRNSRRTLSILKRLMKKKSWYENENENTESYIDIHLPDSIEKFPSESTFHQRLIITDRTYFQEIGSELYIGKLIGFIPCGTKFDKCHKHFSGINAFIKNNIFIKECFVFVIESTFSGEDFDSNGVYCIQRKFALHSLLDSAFSKRKLNTLKITAEDISDLNSNQLRILLNAIYITDYNIKNKTKTAGEDEDQYQDEDESAKSECEIEKCDEDAEIYLVNSSYFRGEEINLERIQNSNRSLNGLIQYKTIDDLNELKKHRGFYTVINKNKKLTCDCIRFQEICLCSHVFAVRDSILKTISLDDLLHDRLKTNTDLREIHSYVGKSVKKYFEKHPISGKRGNFLGKVIGFYNEDERLKSCELFKVRYNNFDEFISIDEISLYIV